MVSLSLIFESGVRFFVAGIGDFILWAKDVLIMTSDRIRISLIDGHRVVLESVALRLSQEPDLEIVATAMDSEKGVPAVLETVPDIMIQGLNFEEPFSLSTGVWAGLPKTKVLFLTAFQSDIYLEQALRIPSTRGYLLKEESVDTVISAIRRVAQGEYCFSPSVQQRLIYLPEEKRYSVAKETCLRELTSRQLEVLRHLARGQSVKEVARIMHLSEKSVDSHKYRIMNKLGIHDRVGLARYAIREGLLVP